ncbi:hypothetical protein [Streptomyces sp. NEAU-H3]|uniref:hypothetical protein n=1 Tax=Streptomyces sp. NEAU-H3 TaxID=2720636 RepID=UPI00143A22C0|nr:hypothetical protein [Streptomyces sp. NEAU-H3]NJA58659.1 hypothetical protein [Streptomyces sp. NEAU-H3]
MTTPPTGPDSSDPFAKGPGAPQGVPPQGGAPGPGGPQWGPPPGYGYPQQPPAGYGHPQQPPAGYGYPQQQAGYGFPPPGPGVPHHGGPAPLLAIGDIIVTQGEITTPAGTMPLRGSVWNASDLSRTEEKISQTGIILAIIFGILLCGLGLLFLLMKERKTSGFIQVTVTSAGHHHSTMVPALGPWSFHQVMQQVNYARSLSV